VAKQKKEMYERGAIGKETKPGRSLSMFRRKRKTLRVTTEKLRIQ
jgi:hypothetical protein